jgi:nucleoside-diphosphate-sugar epimerase
VVHGRMRFFVAGATGYLGSSLVRAAVAAGHDVTALARSPGAAEGARALGATPAAGDLARLETLRAAAAGHDVFVHAAAPSGPDRPAVDRAAMLALLEVAGGRTTIYTSGTWTLGATGDGPAAEDAPADHPPRISAFRPELEREVVAAGGVVLRPGNVYGGRGGVAAWLARWLPEESGRPDHIVLLGDGAYRWPVVHLDDLSRLYLLVAERAARGLFHAVEPEPVRVDRVASRLAELAGRPVWSWPVADAAHALGDVAHAMTLDQHLVAPRAERELGWRPAHRLEDDLPEAWRDLH